VLAANSMSRRSTSYAFGNLARTGNTLIVPANHTDVSTFVSTAMTVLDRTKASLDAPK